MAAQVRSSSGYAPLDGAPLAVDAEQLETTSYDELSSCLTITTT